MATKFAPTQLRGTALARQILDTIEAEERLRVKLDFNATDIDDFARAGKSNAWLQTSWAWIDLDALPPGTEAELIDTTSINLHNSRWNGGDSALALSQGLSCGTAMCFAGHATHLAGDRMIVPVSEVQWSQVLGDKKRGNLRRLMNKAKVKYNSFGRPRFTSNTDWVITEDEKLVWISDRARELLGLSKAEANLLFDAQNSLSTLQLLVAQMEEGRNLITGRKLVRKKR